MKGFSLVDATGRVLASASIDTGLLARSLKYFHSGTRDLTAYPAPEPRAVRITAMLAIKSPMLKRGLRS